MKKIIYIFTFALLLSTVACESTLDNKEEILIENNLNGQWTVSAYMDNDMTFGPFTIETQMTNESDSLFIKDTGEFWNFQTKAKINLQGNAFVTESSKNEISQIGANVKILNGAVINNDITFEILFEDDETPYGIKYTIKGHRN